MTVVSRPQAPEVRIRKYNNNGERVSCAIARRSCFVTRSVLSMKERKSNIKVLVNLCFYECVPLRDTAGDA